MAEALEGVGAYDDGDPGWQPEDQAPSDRDPRRLQPVFVVEPTKGRGRLRKERPKRAEVDPNDKRPLVRIIAGQLDRLATEAEDAVLGSGLPIYQRGSDLVRPTAREVSASKGRTTTTAALDTLGVPAMLDTYCQVARWEKYDGRAEGWVNANPPTQVAQVHLSRSGRWHLPPIAGIITTPTLRPDGTILSAPGYDPATRLYLVPDPALKLPQLPTKPTKRDAFVAIDLIEQLVLGFPFVRPENEEHLNRANPDLAVAIAALITPVVRGAMAVAPLFAIRATTAGTGKSYLVDLASAISTGRPCPVISAGTTPEELEKRLGGLLLEGFPVASIDNVNGELGGDLLCQAIERPLVRVRRLGVSDITEIESRATMFATGNSLRVRGDMVRRTLLCSLDANMERPELREFAFDPVGRVLEDRGRYVAAALTIVRAFLLSGEKALSPLASFDGWSDTVRSALVWLGFADPCDTMEKARDEDPELDEIRELMCAWQQVMGEQAHPVRDVADIADKREEAYGGGSGDYVHRELRDVLLRIAGERGVITTKRLGYWLRGKEGRIVDGRKFVKVGEAHKGVGQWALRGRR